MTSYGGVRSLPVAIVGCGYVASFYAQCLQHEPGIDVVGVFDHSRERAEMLAQEFGYRVFDNEQAVLTSTADVVVNLTPIRAHYDVAANALDAGKHVYSEKPLAASVQLAQALIEKARSAGLWICVAPSTILSRTFAVVRGLVESGRIGRVLLCKVRLDDGPVHVMDHRSWVSMAGVPWPADEEFTAGAVLEHAAYGLSWVQALFGDIVAMAGRSDRLIPPPEKAGRNSDPGPAMTLPPRADSAFWVMSTATGVPCHIDCGQLAPRDNSLTILGESGLLRVTDLMRCDSTVEVSDVVVRSSVGRMHAYRAPEQIHYIADAPRYADVHAIDFAAGLRDLHHSLLTGGSPELSAARQWSTSHAVLRMAEVGSTPWRVNEPIA